MTRVEVEPTDWAGVVQVRVITDDGKVILDGQHKPQEMLDRVARFVAPEDVDSLWRSIKQAARESQDRAPRNRTERIERAREKVITAARAYADAVWPNANEYGVIRAINELDGLLMDDQP
jgi:tRNA A37 N6-isopentenylltransferase MiaA